jgi:thioredoxin-like negative regulator of GroEL
MQLRRGRDQSTGSKPRNLYGNLIHQMERRLDQRPGDLRLRLSLVSHLQKAGRVEEAIRQARDLLRLNPGDRRAKSMLLQLRLEQRLTALRQGLK